MARTLRNLAAALAGLVLVSWSALLEPAAAHVPIKLLILAPKDGQEISGPIAVRIRAQPTIGGGTEVAFILKVDGRDVDTLTGAPVDKPIPRTIQAEQTVEITLQDLEPGPHTVVAIYRPDTDAPVMREKVSFRVAEEPVETPTSTGEGTTPPVATKPPATDSPTSGGGGVPVTTSGTPGASESEGSFVPWVVGGAVGALLIGALLMARRRAATPPPPPPL